MASAITQLLNELDQESQSLKAMRIQEEDARRSFVFNPENNNNHSTSMLADSNSAALEKSVKSALEIVTSIQRTLRGAPAVRLESISRQRDQITKVVSDLLHELDEKLFETQKDELSAISPAPETPISSATKINFLRTDVAREAELSLLIRQLQLMASGLGTSFENDVTKLIGSNGMDCVQVVWNKMLALNEAAAAAATSASNSSPSAVSNSTIEADLALALQSLENNNDPSVVNPLTFGNLMFRKIWSILCSDRQQIVQAQRMCDESCRELEIKLSTAERAKMVLEREMESIQQTIHWSLLSSNVSPVGVMDESGCWENPISAQLAASTFQQTREIQRLQTELQQERANRTFSSFAQDGMMVHDRMKQTRCVECISSFLASPWDLEKRNRVTEEIQKEGGPLIRELWRLVESYVDNKQAEKQKSENVLQHICNYLSTTWSQSLKIKAIEAVKDDGRPTVIALWSWISSTVDVANGSSASSSVTAVLHQQQQQHQHISTSSILFSPEKVHPQNREVVSILSQISQLNEYLVINKHQHSSPLNSFAISPSPSTHPIVAELWKRVSDLVNSASRRGGSSPLASSSPPSAFLLSPKGKDNSIISVEEYELKKKVIGALQSEVIGLRKDIAAMDNIADYLHNGFQGEQLIQIEKALTADPPSEHVKRLWDGVLRCFNHLESLGEELQQKREELSHTVDEIEERDQDIKVITKIITDHNLGAFRNNQSTSVGNGMRALWGELQHLLKRDQCNEEARVYQHNRQSSVTSSPKATMSVAMEDDLVREVRNVIDLIGEVVHLEGKPSSTNGSAGDRFGIKTLAYSLKTAVMGLMHAFQSRNAAVMEEMERRLQKESKNRIQDLHQEALTAALEGHLTVLDDSAVMSKLSMTSRTLAKAKDTAQRHGVWEGPLNKFFDELANKLAVKKTEFVRVKASYVASFIDDQMTLLKSIQVLLRNFITDVKQVASKMDPHVRQALLSDLVYDEDPSAYNLSEPSHKRAAKMVAKEDNDNNSKNNNNNNSRFDDELISPQHPFMDYASIHRIQLQEEKRMRNSNMYPMTPPGQQQQQHYFPHSAPALIGSEAPPLPPSAANIPPMMTRGSPPPGWLPANAKSPPFAVLRPKETSKVDVAWQKATSPSVVVPKLPLGQHLLQQSSIQQQQPSIQQLPQPSIQQPPQPSMQPQSRRSMRRDSSPRLSSPPPTARRDATPSNTTATRIEMTNDDGNNSSFGSPSSGAVHQKNEVHSSRCRHQKCLPEEPRSYSRLQEERENLKKKSGKKGPYDDVKAKVDTHRPPKKHEKVH